MADSGRLEQGAAVESTGLAFLAAYIVNGFGGALGRLVGVRRP